MNQDERQQFLRKKYGAIESPYTNTASFRVGDVQIMLQFDANTPELVKSIQAQWRTPLDLGLAVEQVFVARGTSTEFTVSDSASFSGIFTAQCAPGEHPAARELLTPAVRVALTTLANVGTTSLGDDGLYCGLPAIHPGAFELTTIIDAVVSIGTAMSTAHANLDAPVLLQNNGVAKALSKTAQSLGLSAKLHPFSVHGSHRDVSISLQFYTQLNARVIADQPPFARTQPYGEVSVRFAKPLGCGLSVQSATRMDRLRDVFGVKDLQLHDPAFDAAWTVRAKSEAGARECLNGNTRALLQTLARVGVSLSLDDHGLTGLCTLPANAVDAIRLLESLAELHPSMQQRSTQTPYR